MSSDENESPAEEAHRASPSAPPPAPPVVVGNPSGRWLALVPVSVALVMFLFLIPRAVPPDDVPLPEVDMRVFRSIQKDDAARAARARGADRLPDDVLAVGSALRAFNTAQAHPDRGDEAGTARLVLDHALEQLLGRGGDREKIHDELKTLRAVQLETFLTEVDRFEETGAPSEELDAVGGGFVSRMRAAGWIEGKKVLLSRDERRATFKIVWTALMGAANVPSLAPALDEQRMLYTLYLRRPHAPEAQRVSFELQRTQATAPDQCARADALERISAEAWRADKIRRLGEIDATYPTGYALGVAFYKARRYDESVIAFRTWLDHHPEGAWTLRARNHLKAAMVAAGP